MSAKAELRKTNLLLVYALSSEGLVPNDDLGLGRDIVGVGTSLSRCRNYLIDGGTEELVRCDCQATIIGWHGGLQPLLWSPLHALQRSLRIRGDVA